MSAPMDYAMHCRVSREGGSYVWAATQAFPEGWPAVTVPEAIEVRHSRTPGPGPPPALYTGNPTLRPNLYGSSTLSPKPRPLCPSLSRRRTRTPRRPPPETLPRAAASPPTPGTLRSWSPVQLNCQPVCSLNHSSFTSQSHLMLLDELEKGTPVAQLITTNNHVDSIRCSS